MPRRQAEALRLYVLQQGESAAVHEQFQPQAADVLCQTSDEDLPDDLADKAVRLVEAEGGRFPNDMGQMRREALAWALEHLRGSYHNTDTKWDIEVARAGLEKAVSRRTSSAHFDALAVLPALLRESALQTLMVATDRTLVVRAQPKPEGLGNPVGPGPPPLQRHGCKALACHRPHDPGGA